MLGITGCAHLFGGESAMGRDLLARLAAEGLHARAAVADTAGCAWGVACYGDATDAGGARAPAGGGAAPSPGDCGSMAPNLTFLDSHRSNRCSTVRPYHCALAPASSAARGYMDAAVAQG
jgi:hypothetical protein